MYRAIIPLLLLAGSVGASAQSRNDLVNRAQVELDRDLRGLSAGKPQDCIRHLEAHSSRIYGSTVLFKVSSGLVYRNETRGGCTSSGFQTALQTDQVTNRLCAGDAARTFDPTAGVLTGTCTLGQFVPYRK